MSLRTTPPLRVRHQAYLERGVAIPSGSDIRVPSRVLSAAKQGEGGAPERVGSPAGAEEGYSVPTRPVGTRTNTAFRAEPREETNLVACLLPGLAPTDLNIQRNTQGGGTAHLLDEHAFGGFTLTGGDFEDDFVVHLQ